MALPEIMIGAPLTAGGAFAAGPVGTTPPTDATTKLDVGFVDRGLIGEEGFTLTPNRSTSDIKVWGGSTRRRLTTEFSETLSVTFMESADADVLKAVFGDENVTVDESSGKISIKHSKDGAKEMAWSVTMKDGESRRRVFVPRGQLFLTGAITYVHSDAIKYPVEIACYEDEDGQTSYEYIDDTTVSGG